MKNYKYSKFIAIALFFSIANLVFNTATATAEINHKRNKSSVKLSSLNETENQSLSLHLLLAHSFKDRRQTINLQQNDFQLSEIEQKIPLRDRSLITRSFSGKASWYGPGFHGRLTANGERYNQNAMTAAHRNLRFGTRVKVTNLNNGRSVIVRINDRGPFIKGRVIDVSAAAARSLNMVHSGVAPVEIIILGR